MSDSATITAPSAMPWSIKGVRAEIRQIAKEEAAKAGITIGAWISRTIREASQDPALFAKFQISTGATPMDSQANENGLVAYLQKMDEKLNTLTERLQTLEQGDIEPAPVMAEVGQAAKSWPVQ